MFFLFMINEATNDIRASQVMTHSHFFFFSIFFILRWITHHSIFTMLSRVGNTHPHSHLPVSDFTFSRVSFSWDLILNIHNDVTNSFFTLFISFFVSASEQFPAVTCSYFTFLHQIVYSYFNLCKYRLSNIWSKWFFFTVSLIYMLPS